MAKHISILLIGTAFTVLLFAYSIVKAQSSEPIQPFPLNIEVNTAKAVLGRKLFFDTRLSIDRTISCASCHDVDYGWGAESKAVSDGVKSQLGVRNSPTVFNSSFNFKQFWDGRADTLSHQAIVPVINPFEMGMTSWNEVVERLKDDASYIIHFTKIYGEELSKDSIIDAIAEYEKTLVTVDSPFDRYLRGDPTAITATQKQGYELFKSYGCVSCHQGMNVGGNMFQKFGVLEDITLQGGNLSQDLGRFAVTSNEWDKRVFKVPSLRLATRTAPYFHNGSIATIEEAVDIMIKFQLGRNVPNEHRDAIILFLGSLGGDRPVGIK